MKNLVVAAALVALALAPASGRNAACTGENFAKMTDRMVTMPHGPKKMAIMKEVAAINAGLSNGDLSGACKHYVLAREDSGQQVRFLRDLAFRVKHRAGPSAIPASDKEHDDDIGR